MSDTQVMKLASSILSNVLALLPFAGVFIMMLAIWLRRKEKMERKASREAYEASLGRRESMSQGEKDSLPFEMPLEVPELYVPGPIPKYTIDLSLPPRERYAKVATAYKYKLVELPKLFDELLQTLSTYSHLLRPWWVKQLARLALRRVYDDEQMEEIRGIQKATDIPLYLLVAFNLLLDLMVGCTSGGVKVECKAEKGVKGSAIEKRMMHFRTLDWGMDPLREIVVELEFVAHAGGPVVARSVTYLGFVGVLTGVRKDLSVSFNFRSNIKAVKALSSWEKIRYAGGKVLVLLGRRPSIPCTLRKYVIAGTHREGDAYSLIGQTLPGIEEITNTFPSLPTAQCFVILSDGDRTIVIEKDWKSAVLRSDSAFIACTNHDQSEEETTERNGSTHQLPESEAISIRKENIPSTAAVTGMEEILEESVDRKHNIEKKWLRAKATYSKNHEDADAAVPIITVRRWLRAKPVCAECTHFGVVMDPKKGEVVWAERYPIPEYESEEEVWDRHSI